MSQTFADLRCMPPLPTGRGRSRDAWPDQIDHVALGAIAGLIATGLMTAVIASGRALRLLNTPPPAQITANLAERAGVDPEEEHVAFRLVWLAAHGGYGVACGAGYVAARPILPRSTALAGLVYGGVIWGASYFGLMPALGLYPWPEDDTKSRLGVMMLAHVVFGVSLAEVERRLTHRS